VPVSENDGMKIKIKNKLWQLIINAKCSLLNTQWIGMFKCSDAKVSVFKSHLFCSSSKLNFSERVVTCNSFSDDMFLFPIKTFYAIANWIDNVQLINYIGSHYSCMPTKAFEF
jgi:hypothetical protein